MAVRAGARPPQPDVVTVPEFAELLRVTPDTVRMWLREHRVRGIKVGKSRQGRWRIPRSELTRFAVGK